MSETTYSAFVTDWLAFIERTKSRQTHTTYGYLIKEFERFVDHKPWAKVTRDDVHAFLRRPRVKKASGRPAKDSTQRDISIIRSFFTWLAGEGRMSRDALPIYNLERPRTDEDAVEREPVQEWVWKAVWDSSHPTMDDRLWLGLGYFCGLRRQEMAHARSACRVASFGSSWLGLAEGAAQGRGQAVGHLVRPHLQDAVRPERGA